MNKLTARLGIYVFIVLLGAQELNAQVLYKTTVTEASIIFGTSVGLFGGSKLIEDSRGPIIFENLDLLDFRSINNLDRNTVNNFSSSAGIASDYFRDGAWAVPLTLFLSGKGRENAKEILIMYGEIFALNGAITKFTKGAFGRYRPYSYNPQAPLDLRLSETTRRSFFSGHVSHVASLSFFTATVFDDLYPESDFRYVVWAAAITAPAVTGYLRTKAGRHFPSDVIVGYAVGSLIGYLIPELHKITHDSDIQLIGAEGGLGLTYTF